MTCWLVTADWHLDIETAPIIFGEVIPGLLAGCKEHDAAGIIVLGDLWNTRYRLPVVLVNQFLDSLSEFSKNEIALRLLPGNHDQVDVSGRNALEVLGCHPQVTVYTEPESTPLGYFYPYRKDTSGLRREFEGRKRGLAFIHGGVCGAEMNDAIFDSDGVPASVFADTDLVLAGHYHKRQRVGSVQYVGSPYEVSAAEAGQPKGYAVLVDGRVRFVDTAWGPRHYNVTIKSGDDFDPSQFRATDIVRVTTEEGVDPEQIGRSLVAAGVRRHVVTPKIKPQFERLAIGDHEAGVSLRAYAAAYAALKKGEEEVDPLLVVFDELRRAARGDG